MNNYSEVEWSITIKCKYQSNYYDISDYALILAESNINFQIKACYEIYKAQISTEATVAELSDEVMSDCDRISK